jgi:hypothetical protein
MSKFDWFGLAPYGAGAPPALVLSINLYKSVMTVVDRTLWPVAALIAAIGVIGMMAVEIGTYKMLARAFAQQEWKAALFALFGALTVTGMVIFSVYSGADTRSLFSSTAVMVVGYVAIMVREYLGTKDQAKQTAINMQISLINAEKNKINAETRKARADGLVHVDKSQTKAIAEKLSEEKIDIIREYWRTYPDSNYRQVAQACGCSPSTAGKYKP